MSELSLFTALVEDLDGKEDHICPAEDALFKIHDRVIADEMDAEVDDGEVHVIVRLLVPSDQIGCIIGKGGQIVQKLCNDSVVQVHIMKDDHLLASALKSNELMQVSGSLVW